MFILYYYYYEGLFDCYYIYFRYSYQVIIIIKLVYPINYDFNCITNY